MKRLAVAKVLLSECSLLMRLMSAVAHRPPVEGDPLWQSIQGFLTSQLPNDFIMVSREDAQYYLHFAQTQIRLGGYSQREIEVINRLKVALEMKEELCETKEKFC